MYERELKVAVAAARTAGEILGTEFDRVGGPRGSPDHCDADVKAEKAIRSALTSTFPLHGIVGEELSHQDRLARDVEQHVWLVDPNDGTSAFLERHRGSAVSVALLKSGRPVLGVVFAFGHDDLIAWANGQQLTRNGISAKRRALPTILKSKHTVLLSLDADRNVKASSALVAPARFRALPSIAYRLALVAVGDGDATISMNCPVSWDYAAGHGLLLAVGGNIFNRQGRPVTYGIDGHGSCVGACVGASAPVARRLTEKLRRASFGIGTFPRTTVSHGTSKNPDTGGRSDPTQKEAEVPERGWYNRGSQ